MHWINLLIILGCLAGGYWLVSSIMEPGVDLTRKEIPRDAKPPTGDVDPQVNPHAHDWHLILDLPAHASRREIEQAYRRRLKKAEGTGDSGEGRRIRLAYEAAMRRAAS
jgi:hypothetical protein